MPVMYYHWSANLRRCLKTFVFFYFVTMQHFSSRWLEESLRNLGTSSEQPLVLLNDLVSFSKYLSLFISQKNGLKAILYMRGAKLCSLSFFSNTNLTEDSFKPASLTLSLYCLTSSISASDCMGYYENYAQQQVKTWWYLTGKMINDLGVLIYSPVCRCLCQACAAQRVSQQHHLA